MGQGVERGKDSDLSPAAHGGTVESRLVNPLRGPDACDLGAAPGTREESGEGKTGPGDGTGVGSRSLVVHGEREHA